MMKGIYTIVVTTILLIAPPLWAEKGGKARKLATASGNTAITQPILTSQSTSSARSSTGVRCHWTPMDDLIQEIYGQGTKRQGQARGKVVGEHPYPDWIFQSSGTSIQRHPGLTRRRYSNPANPVGGQVRVRTTRYPDGSVKIDVRDLAGRPVHWNMEAHAWVTSGIHASN